MEKYLNSSQMEASDPEASVWTMASAGTGKTTVLIARLMKLLLTGARPSKIICLTFTNTAASEIRSRIHREVAKWSNDSDLELLKLIRVLFGQTPPGPMLKRARALSETTNSSLDTIRVCTIHSFCQHVLSRFPIEAGVAPAFRVIDEMLSSQILQQLKAKVMTSSRCKDAIAYFARNFHETRFDQILTSATSGRFASTLSSFNSEESYRAHLASLMSIGEGLTEEGIIKQQIDSFLDPKVLEEISSISPKLERYLSMERQEKLRNWKGLGTVFLDSKGFPRKNLIPANLAGAHLRAKQSLESFQTSFLDAFEKVNKLSTLNASAHLFCLARELVQLYSAHKKSRGFLDYGDLISFAANLFTKSGDREWVLYKLDGGIDHVLVDEAQDTSTEQWKVVSALVSDFFSSAPCQSGRSIFVVGDVKQSIYSFQGARVESLEEVQRYIASNLKHAGGFYKEVDLRDCYRSSQTIVDFVRRALEASSATFSVPHLHSARSTLQGRIEVWPIFFSKAPRSHKFWPLPDQSQHHANGKESFARTVAFYIKSLLAKGIVLPSTGLPIRESDITILVQRRNDFTRTLAEALRNQGIAVSGLDRIKLKDNLTILDIIAIAKFALLPSDDLNCAILLKSPIFSFTEEEIFELTLAESIWIGLLEPKYGEARLLLERLLEIYSDSSLFDFFYVILDAMGFREKLLKGNDEGEGDVIDEFLEVAKQFESQVSDDLYRFVRWFLNNEVEAKRDVAQEGFVKIMTVHACKGMESGVVIVPDSTSLEVKEHALCVLDDAVFLIRHESEFTKACKELRQKLDYQEYLRLMYVAFTRCKDYLIICGHCSNKAISPLSWHAIAHKAMEGVGFMETLELGELSKEVMVVQKEPFLTISPKETKDTKSKVVPPLPHMSFKGESQGNGGLSPLQPTPTTYGTLVHKALELLVYGAFPDESKLEGLQVERVMTLLSRLLNGAEKVLTEISIKGHPPNSNVIRLDLLILSKGFIDIVDYKTGHHADPSLVPAAYREQMLRYANAVKGIYPQMPVRCWLLWVDTCCLVQVN